jgi:hypothetical protein
MNNMKEYFVHHPDQKEEKDCLSDIHRYTYSAKKVKCAPERKIQQQ